MLEGIPRFAVDNTSGNLSHELDPQKAFLLKEIRFSSSGELMATAGVSGEYIARLIPANDEGAQVYLAKKAFSDLDVEGNLVNLDPPLICQTGDKVIVECPNPRGLSIGSTIVWIQL